MSKIDSVLSEEVETVRIEADDGPFVLRSKRGEFAMDRAAAAARGRA